MDDDIPIKLETAPWEDGYITDLPGAPFVMATIAACITFGVFIGWLVCSYGG